MQARGCVVEIQTGVVGTDGSGYAGAANGIEEAGGERCPRARGERGDDGPILDCGAAPAIEESSTADADAGAVLRGECQDVALVEVGESTFATEVGPVLRDEGADA